MKEIKSKYGIFGKKNSGNHDKVKNSVMMKLLKSSNIESSVRRSGDRGKKGLSKYL